MFESQNGDFDIQKQHINGKGELVITAGLTNNGILGKTDVEAAIFPAKTITIDMFGAAFYRDFEYKMVTHARVFSLKPKFEITDRQGIYLSTTFYFLRYKFEYGNMCSWAKIQDVTISLPTLSTGELAFEYMEAYIRELEEERVRELAAYLTASGLEDYHLTATEQNAIDLLRNGKVEMREFRIGELFEKIRTKSLKYKVGDLPTKPTEEYNLPALTAGIINQGLSCFVPRDNATILKNVISVSGNGANTGAMFFQTSEFTVLQDSYALKIKNDYLENPTKNQYLYLVGALSKTIRGNFDWSNKAGWEKVKKENISLPILSSGEIDYAFMQHYISAVQKIAIKNVVLWKDRQIAAAKGVVGA